jgi:hypothetical protein
MNGTSAVPPSGTKKNQSHTSNSVYPLFTTMGIQSQYCEGSIKKCRKIATKDKYKRRKFQQYLVTGGLDFYGERNCIMCKAKAKRCHLWRL